MRAGRGRRGISRNGSFAARGEDALLRSAPCRLFQTSFNYLCYAATTFSSSNGRESKEFAPCE